MRRWWLFFTLFFLLEVSMSKFRRKERKDLPPWLKRNQTSEPKKKDVIFQATDKSRLQEILHQTADQNNNILVAYTNSGFHEMTRNFLYSLENTIPPITNILLFPLDCEEFVRSQNLRISSFFTRVEHNKTALPFAGPPGKYGFHYYEVVQYKWKILEMVLQAGYNVLLTDVDIFWLRNPFYLLETMPQCDFTFYCGKIAPPKNLSKCLHVNTGLMYFRSNERSLELIKQIKFPRYRDDQTVFNKLLDKLLEKYYYDEKTVLEPDLLSGQCGQLGDFFTFQRIPPFLIGNPRTLFGDSQSDVNNLIETQTRPYGVHFNYLNGIEAKIRSMTHHSMWKKNQYSLRKSVVDPFGEEVCKDKNFFREVSLEH